MAIVSLDGRPLPEDLPRAQLAAIAHRGEWEPRLWEAPGVALGHVNLPRTPEAEREFLPMSDTSGRYWLTWDGRLDNRDELGPLLGYDVVERAEKPDAAYVLDAFIKWGDDCVHHLLGDWAVVIWDNHSRRLFCAKDPVGYRQLFFRQSAGMLIVGSEPQQLFAGSSQPPQPDRGYTLRYLAGVLQIPGTTWLDSVLHLAGGEILASQNSAVHIQAFWLQPSITRRRYKRVEQYVDEFEATFATAVKARLRTNRPVGVYLSGGIDSSYVAATIVRSGAEAVAITSYAPGTRRMDERRYADLVVAHLGMEQLSLDISDCWTLSSRWLPDSAFDGPFVPGQGANHIRMGVGAKERGLGVVLGGEGGDEWSNGPESFRAHAMAHGRFATAWRLARIGRTPQRAARQLLKDGYRGLTPRVVQSSLDSLRGSASGSRRNLPEGWVDIFEFLKDASAWSYTSYQRTQWDVYRQSNWLEPSWRDRHEVHPNRLERRPPFFDLRVIELMASIPPWVKRFRGRRKDILREAEYRVLPAVLADRQDWGLYDELYFDGLRQEQARIEVAVNAVERFTGTELSAEAKHALASPAPPINWEAARVAASGLWLTNMRSTRPAALSGAVSGRVGGRVFDTHPPRKEVIA